MTGLTEDESVLRLMVFGGALLAIAARGPTWLEAVDPMQMGSNDRAKCLAEASAIADAVVAEARHLKAELTKGAS